MRVTKRKKSGRATRKTRGGAPGDIKTMSNSGVPTEQFASPVGHRYSNQCLWISIMQYLHHYKGVLLNIDDIRRIGGLSVQSTSQDSILFDDRGGWKDESARVRAAMSAIRIYLLEKHDFDITIEIFLQDYMNTMPSEPKGIMFPREKEHDSNRILPIDVKTNIIPILLWSGTNSGHFELITKYTTQTGIKQIDLVIPSGFSHKSPPRPPPRPTGTPPRRPSVKSSPIRQEQLKLQLKLQHLLDEIDEINNQIENWNASMTYWDEDIKREEQQKREYESKVAESEKAIQRITVILTEQKRKVKEAIEKLEREREEITNQIS